MDVIRQRPGDVPIRLCKETLALHRHLGTSQRSCCYTDKLASQGDYRRTLSLALRQRAGSGTAPPLSRVFRTARRSQDKRADVRRLFCWAGRLDRPPVERLFYLLAVLTKPGGDDNVAKTTGGEEPVPSLSSVLALGLTGSFGSGCTTLGNALFTSRDFRLFSLSKTVKSQWDRENPGIPPDRGKLQDVGNMLAGTEGTDYLAECAADEADNSGATKVVFDSIKREGEINYLRARYPSFYLVAVQCSRDERWRRVRPTYERVGLGESDFDVHDARDQIEEVSPGQQVSLCVDDADIVVDNTERRSQTAAGQVLRSRIDRYIGLITGSEPYKPRAQDIAMTVAYTEAEWSDCIKRHVGATIVDEDGSLISSGFNQNPATMKPCYEEPGYCRKDSLVAERLEALLGTYCPHCGKLIESVNNPFRCSCGYSLKSHYFSDHGVRWCPAVHAEERAIARVRGRDLSAATLYTTTFPCLNCAKLITDSGLKKIVYVEPYPERESVRFLAENRIDTIPFEGVKARSFHKLFKPYREQMEVRYRLPES